jgi:hypothetical protein
MFVLIPIASHSARSLRLLIHRVASGHDCKAGVELELQILFVQSEILRTFWVRKRLASTRRLKSPGTLVKWEAVSWEVFVL